MVSIKMDELVRRFQTSGQKVPYIIYDVDDVLWDLIGHVADRLEINTARASAVFSIRANQQLSLAEQDAIIHAFADPSMFEDIQFFPGIQDILRPRELGAKVGINSNSFNQQIAELKRAQLLAAIPGLRNEDLQLNIINYGSTHRKEFAPNMTIFVDDSPHNVALSPAQLNIMPMTVRWAWCADALHMVADKPTIWQPDLVAINQYIYDAVAAMMKAS